MKILKLLKNNAVLCVAIVAAVITAFIVPPDEKYLGYFDLSTLYCLFGTLAVVEGLARIGFFEFLARKIVVKFKNLRAVTFALVFITYFGSMVMANDMALITFLPLGYYALESTGRKDKNAFVFVMQNVAANLGGMLTPFGNPQNLYLYSYYKIPTGEFFYIMLAPFIAAFLLIFVCCFFVKPDPVTLETERENKPDAFRSVAYLVLFAVAVASVMRLFPYYVGVSIAVAGVLILDFKSFAKVNYGGFIFFGKGSSFHLEKNERASGFAFSILGEGYRLRIEQFDRKDPELKGVGSKCKIDFSKDGITYTNTDTQKIALSYIFTYDEGNYNFTPVSRSTIAIEVAPNQTVTVSKQNTGFAITGGGEVYVQTMPMIAHKEQDAFDGSYEEYLDWLGSYFINFVRSKDVLLQFNTEKECSELVYDFDGDGVFDDAPMLGDADGDGKPYEPSDIYWTMLHIADKAITSHGARRYYRGHVPNIEADTDNNGKIDTNDLFDIVYECALRGAGLKK